VFGLGAWTLATADRLLWRGFLGALSLILIVYAGYLANYQKGAERLAPNGGTTSA